MANGRAEAMFDAFAPKEPECGWEKPDGAAKAEDSEICSFCLPGVTDRKEMAPAGAPHAERGMELEGADVEGAPDDRALFEMEEERGEEEVIEE